MDLGGDQGSEARTRQLLATGRQIENARESLEQANRTALETEAAMNQVAADLARQRGTVESISGSVGRIDNNITGSRRVIMQMVHRNMIKKVALWFMVALLLITLGV
eukprot:CAMPEP_0115476008 /NCGR_PEP_ID=MMETSP0271-20121206/54911_1 /TAXON_ID=71861 /ORGANISM="Scrippsiella trochoidea, Strain CCMP3099" /LENGTH=106 /DNA_ID=CAMNT_0002903399 /DNA_START=65 /DNA_END=382 /DNA_ORIENTATION=+